MFNCSVCKEKDNRIEDLREQISYLRNILNPPVSNLKQKYIEQTDLQQDMILSGGGKEETELESEPADTPEVLAERAAMLSGTY